jgi:hypothetical protein
VLLAVLQRLGVHRAEAERLLRADPAQTYEVVCWVLYAQRHEPESIRDPGPYVRKAVAEGYRFAKPAYLKWRTGVQARALDLVRARATRAADPAPTATAATLPPAVDGAPISVPVANAAEPAAEAPAGYAFAGADADAAALWDGVCAELRRQAGPRDLRLLWVTTQLHLVAGARLEGAALVCVTPDLAMRTWMGAPEGRALLGALAAGLTAGAVNEVVARLPGDLDRAA